MRVQVLSPNELIWWLSVLWRKMYSDEKQKKTSVPFFLDTDVTCLTILLLKFLIFFCQFAGIKLLYLRGNLVDVFLDEVGADVGGTRNDEEFLVGGAGGFGESFL